ncbi:major facilitator superfamily domain-containing protein 4A [Nephila pilipes]|uniref:Major facilitator superfamily domain-containing protein 4A n=1 Tax=Nephila pilipes TaxID=299642 RepID=A0A8X6TP41_NEPPI|nr:major facilitator superfamily domain-containing protein 4A [Nephila pilipes]
MLCRAIVRSMEHVSCEQWEKRVEALSLLQEITFSTKAFLSHSHIQGGSWEKIFLKMANLSSKRLKIIKTFNLYISSISSGVSMAVIGPVLLDLQEIVHTDTEHIAFIYTGRSNGYLFGSLVGGVLFDMTLKKQLLMTVFNFLIAISLLIIPWCKYIGMLTGWMILNGFSMGALDTGLNVCTLNLWGKDSGPYYQALHFMYGFGSLLAPLIAAPFLGDYHEEAFSNETASYTNETFLLDSTELNFSNGSFSQNSKIPGITYAFSIIGGFAALVTICFFIVCIISPYDADGKKNETMQTKKNGRLFVVMIVSLTFALLFVETGTEIGFAQMLTTYSVKGPLKLTPVMGSYITSAFWTAFTISRFASIFFAIKMKSLHLIILDLVLVSIGSAILLFLAVSKEWALWLATIFLGLGIASMYATVITWVEHYIEITNKVLGLFATGAAFGEMAIPYTISYFLAKIPEVLAYVVAASCILSIILTIILYLILRNKQDKYLEQEGTSNAAFDGHM